MRDAAYALQPPEERAALHAAALAAIEGMFDDAAREPMCAELADHALAARVQDGPRFAALGKSEAAYRLRAALAAAQSYRNTEALAGLRAVYEHPDAEPPQRIKALVEATEILAFMPNALEGVALAERAAEIAESIGDTRNWLYARKRVTWLRSTNGELDQALTEQYDLVRRARNLNDTTLIAGLLSDLATMQRRAGQYELAIESQIEALGLSHQLGIPRGIGTVQMNLGAIYLTRGQREQAEALLRSAVENVKLSGHKRTLRTAVSNLAIALRQSDPVEAERLVMWTLDLARETGDQESLGESLAGLAALRHAQGREEEAEALFRESIAITEESGSRRRNMTAQGNLGSLLESLGRLDEAETWYHRALDAARRLSDIHAEAYWNVSLGMVAARRGRWEDVAGFCTRCSHEAEHSKDPLLEAVYRSLQALVARSEGALARAEALWGNAQSLFEAAKGAGKHEQKALNSLWDAAQRDN